MVIALYNTFVEVEIVFWAFGIAKFRAEYCVVSETKYDVTHRKWGKENHKKARFGATLVTSLPKDRFRGLSPEIYRTLVEGLRQWPAVPRKYLSR